jgi:ABC-type sugar transport system, permease component
MKGGKILIYVLTAILAVLFLVPYLWVVVESISPISTQGLIIPSRFTFSAFGEVLTNPTLINSLINGLIISLSGTALSILFAIGPSYIFSRKRFKGRIGLLLTILFLTGFPVFSLLIPTYVFFLHVGLFNTYIGVIFFLAAINLPITIWIMKNSFDQIPKNIERAATIDGASQLNTITNIFLPLAAPSLAVIMLLDFILNWGNFYVPYILISSGHLMPVAVEVYSFFGAFNVQYNELALFR